MMQVRFCVAFCFFLSKNCHFTTSFVVMRLVSPTGYCVVLWILQIMVGRRWGIWLYVLFWCIIHYAGRQRVPPKPISPTDLGDRYTLDFVFLGEWQLDIAATIHQRCMHYVQVSAYQSIHQTTSKWNFYTHIRQLEPKDALSLSTIHWYRARVGVTYCEWRTI